jgi:hypothetical protein
MDVFTFRPLQIRKLYTKEDGAFFHVHKILGVLALCHYIYRFHEWYMYGYMQFDGSWSTLALIFTHTGLSTSSMIFHIPNIRNRAAPMIWPEFRLHSIIFAMRSLVAMVYQWTLLHFFGTAPMQGLWDLRPYMVVVGIMMADFVTRWYPPQGSTMRVMPFPKYVPEWFVYALNIYYSICQVYATMEILTRSTMAYPFMILFPIQIAAFLMTCVRKSIITAAGWHFWYASSLMTTATYVILSSDPERKSPSQLLLYNCCIVFFVVERFVFKINKYKLWACVILAHYAQVYQYFARWSHVYTIDE